MTQAGRLRALPSVDEVAGRIAPAAGDCPRRLLIAEIRRAIDLAREEIRNGSNAAFDIDRRVIESVERLRRPSLRQVINATGVVLHTNLGRAPLPEFDLPCGYTNLEYDVETGRRGRRDQHVAALLERLLGKPAIAVNNNAAGVFLALHELAARGEAIVSRGQLIEIGDGFRIPDIMEHAGVTLREVGTTNRTRIEDYRDAINERTRLLLLVHPSNFRIEGFTGRPSREEVVALGRERRIPVYEDLGSGCLSDLSAAGIEEPLATESLAAGVDVVSFSGDKLLGGPQAGILAGDPLLIARLRRNPMFRALRLDKLILAALESTLRLYVFEKYDAIPALRMIRLSADEIRVRAERLVAQLPGLAAEVAAGESVIGGGSTPEQSLPTWRISIKAPHVNALKKRLRANRPPVIALIEDDRIMLDLRTVLEEQEAFLVQALRTAFIPDPSSGAEAAR
jgi:L-seryl-tRNA(Ser) seleniumtransferase